LTTVRSRIDLLRVKIDPALPMPKGEARYRRDEYSLGYNGALNLERASTFSEIIDGRLRVHTASSRFVTAGFLTLVFTEPGWGLASLDAYTNSELWLPSTGESSRIAGTGALVFDDDERIGEDDRMTLNTDPQFLFDRECGRLRILFTDGTSFLDRAFRVGEQLIARVDEEGRLQELALENVKLR
jgi:hypothetical protein